METLKQWMCISCWIEIACQLGRVPQLLSWSDGHICTFKSPEDLDMSNVISYDDLYKSLEGMEDVHLTSVEFPDDKIEEAYKQEVALMQRYALAAENPSLFMGGFRRAGSQCIAEFAVNDLQKPAGNSINWHGQNTSQWVYAGCILYDTRGNRVSRHH